MKTTTVTSTGEDEMYCEWFKCNSCGIDGIQDDANFCPYCGLKIKKGEQE
jgi:hypothetical protein